MTGTSVIFSFLAAAKRAWPAIITPSAPTRIGFGPAELDDAGRNLRHLLVGVGARVAGIGDQLFN